MTELDQTNSSHATELLNYFIDPIPSLLHDYAYYKRKLSTWREAAPFVIRKLIHKSHVVCHHSKEKKIGRF